MTWEIPHNTTIEPVQLWKIILASVLLAHAIICLTIIQPLYYTRRHHEYFRHRLPGLVIVFNVYSCVTMISITAQELLVSSGQHWPCIITWLINMTNLCLMGVPSITRGWMVAVKFTPKLRNTALRTYVTKTGQRQMIRTLACVCVPFYIAMLFAFPSYLDFAGDRQCCVNSEWYFYLAYTLYQLNNSKELRHCIADVNDYYQIGNEIRLGFNLQALVLIYYGMEIIMFGAQYGGIISRADIEQYAVPIDYYMYALYSVRVHGTSTYAMYQYQQWYRRHHQRRVSASTLSGSSFANARSSIAMGFDSVSQDEFMQGGGIERKFDTPIRTQVVKENGDPSKRWNLVHVLNNDELRAVFTVHANKSLCGEMMVFCNEMHAFKLQIHMARQMCVANLDTKPHTSRNAIVPVVKEASVYGVTANEIKTFGCGLFYKFVAVDSDFELNVSATLRQQFEFLIAELKGNTLPIKMKRNNSVCAIAICETDEQRVDALWQLCNALQEEIYNLLNTNLFKSFKNTTTYNNFVMQAAGAVAGG